MQREKVEFSQALVGKLLMEYPLYRKVYTEPPKTLPSSLRDFLSETIYHWCENNKCEREQPFTSSRSFYLDKTVDELKEELQESLVPKKEGGWQKTFGYGHRGTWGTYSIRYVCSICWFTELWFSVKIDFDTATYIEKVGQSPPLELPIDRRLAKKLGKEDEQLFRRAQMSISQSYGIGACAYLRRIVENKIDRLLELYRDKRTAEGADPGEIAKIEVVMKTIVFEDKVKLLRPELPSEIEVEGHNPVYLMYDRLSNGIHNLNDQECVAVAQEVSALLTEILVGLEEQKERSRKYNEGIKALAKPKADASK